MKAIVEVWLKTGIADPVGEDFNKRLKGMGLHLKHLNLGKYFEIEVQAEEVKEGMNIVKDACEKLLANPVVEDFKIKITDTIEETPG